MTKWEIDRVHKTPLLEALNTSDSSPIRRYMNKTVGDNRIDSLLRYDIALVFLSNIDGGIGYFLRKMFYGRLFYKFGDGVILGKGISLRHPSRIALGNRVAIDDYSLLDGGGAGDEIVNIGDDIIISINCVLQAKTGTIVIERETDIGCNCVITSNAGIYIGKSVLIAANCYIGGGRYITDRINVSIMEPGLYSKGPVVIGEGSWLGAGAIVLDGIYIGKGSVVGAGSVVTKNIPNFSIVTGIPAKIIAQRTNV